jgi:hypothetical protein
MSMISMNDEDFHIPSFTSAELNRWGKKLAALAPVVPSMKLSAHRLAGLSRRRWARFCELWPKIVDAIFMTEQRLVERQQKHWVKFCDVWSKIGLITLTGIFEELPLPRSRPRPNLSMNLLDKLDPQKPKSKPSQATLDRVSNYLTERDKLKRLASYEDREEPIAAVQRIYAGLTNLERKLVNEMSK